MPFGSDPRVVFNNLYYVKLSSNISFLFVIASLMYALTESASEKSIDCILYSHESVFLDSR